MGSILDNRRDYTASRITELKSRLDAAQGVCGTKACVYMTGSVGRGEATQHSDLDLFILAGEMLEGGARKRCLTRLDEIRLKANLIEANRSQGIRDFSGDGAYLVAYSGSQLKENLGKDNDDSDNTFTARLLMLLESRTLVGADAVYRDAIHDVLATYWKDYSDHAPSFVPAFLANDILRYWRTLCVNYEARTEKVPAEKKAERKLKNYKLKHSRLLTCYSAILWLLDVQRQKQTVAPESALEMVALTPTQRLEQLAAVSSFERPVQVLLGLYERFLTETDAPEPDLVARFMDKAQADRLLAEASEFGDQVAELVDVVGRGTSLRRLLLV